MAVRNLQKGERAMNEVLQKQPSARVELMCVDLADVKSIENFAENFKAKFKQLHVLINNAGIMLPNQRKETIQGFEALFGTNYLGHFALTGMLMEPLQHAGNARIVTVASFVPKMNDDIIHWNDLYFKNSYDGMKAYGQSKLANIMFGLSLNEKLKKHNCDILSVLANPGYTRSGMQRHMGFLTKVMSFIIAQKVEMGMLSILRGAIDPNIKGGEFYGPLKMKEMRGYPRLTAPPKPALNHKDRQKLWDMSEQLTGVHFNFDKCG